MFNIQRLFILGLILLSGLLLGGDPKLIKEISSPSLFYLLLVFLFWKFAPARVSNWFRFDLNRILLITFAFVSTIQVLTFIVGTEIPRYKTMFRLVYFLYSVFLTSRYSEKFSWNYLILFTVLLFSGFPFQWAFFSGTSRSIPLVLLLVYGIITQSRSSESGYPRLNLKSPVFILTSLALFSFLFANLYNLNFNLGLENVFRLLTGILVFFFIRRIREPEVPRRIISLIILISLFHICLFLAAGIIRSITDSSYTFLFSRTVSLLAINTNDISGYLIVLFPLNLGILYQAKKIRERKVLFIIVCLILNMILLAEAKSRLAWPVVALSIIFSIFTMAKYNKELHQVIRRFLIPLSGIMILGAAVFSVVLYFYYPTTLSVLLDSGSMGIRLQLWKLALINIMNSPLSGIGAENYRVFASLPLTNPQDFASLSGVYLDWGVIVHCHNLYLQLWLDGGLLYLVSILILAGLGIYGGFTQAAKSSNAPLYLGASISLIGIFLQGGMNYHFINYPTWLIFWGLLGFLIPAGKGVPSSDGFSTISKRVSNLVVIAGLFFLCYMGTVLYLHSNSLNLLSSIRKRNNADYFVLDKSTLTKSMTAKAGKSLRLMTFAMQLNPWDPERRQILGEIQYYLFRVTDEKRYILQAQENLKSCIELEPRYSYCYKRLADIELRLQGGPTPEYESLLKQADLYDPFQLNKKGKIKRY